MTDTSPWDPSSVTIASLNRGCPDPEIPENVANPLIGLSDVYDENLMLKRMISSVKISFIGAKNRHSQVTAEEVARKFRCGLETAKQTLKMTTQHAVQQAIHPLH
jgi:hypothetical protein